MTTIELQFMAPRMHCKINLGLSYYLLSLLGLFGALLFSFQFSFDFTDEGLYLYHLSKGSEAHFLSFYHILVHPLGALFGHQLFGYRVLAMLSVFSFSLLATYKFFNIYKISKLYVFLPPTLSLAYFRFNSSFSYNTMGALAAYLLVFSTLGYLETTRNNSTNRRSSPYIFLLSLSLFIATAARPPFGIAAFFCILGLFIFANWSQKNIILKDGSKFIAFNFLFFGFFTFFYWSYINDIITLIRPQLDSTHGKLLRKIYLDTREIISKNIFWLIALFGLSKGLSKVLKLNMLIFIAPLISSVLLYYSLINYDSINLFHTLIALALLLITYLIINFKKYSLNQPQVIGILSLVVIPFLSGLGTNGNIYTSAIYAMSLFALPFTLIFDRLPLKESIKNRLFLFIFSLVSVALLKVILEAGYFSPYRSSGPEKQSTYFSNSLLKGVRHEKDFNHILSRTSETLSKINFNMTKDKIFSYPDLPGVTAVLRANAFGNPWNFTGYSNSDISNCAYIKIESYQPDSKIYLLLADEPSASLKKCLFDRIVPMENKTEVLLGELYHYRNEKNYSLTLSGPYKMLK